MSAYRRETKMSPRAVENLDRAIRSKNRDKWIKYSKGHLNSPVASICWKCSRPLEPRKNELPLEPRK